MLTGRLVGMADDADSKSVAGDRVRVQVPQPAVTKEPGKAMKFSELFRAFSQTKRWIMDCYTAEQKITGFIQNELDDSETEAFLNHIRSCESCRSELETNYFIVEGLRMLDTDSDDFDVKGTMDRAIRSAYQRLRTARGWRIVLYSVNTLVFLSVISTLLLELRILFYK